MMGCSALSTRASSATTIQVRPAEGRDCIFTDRQKSIVRKTWRVLATDLTGRGSKVFVKIFELHPEIKSLFPFRNVSGDALLLDVSFKGHASRFMNAVGAVVDNLDNLDEALAPLLTGLGENHVNFHGFKPDYFNVFAQAMNAIWREDLGRKYTSEAEEAWKEVFAFIMKNLKDGFLTSESNSIKK